MPSARKGWPSARFRTLNASLGLVFRRRTRSECYYLGHSVSLALSFSRGDTARRERFQFWRDAA
jgi:hypothetical protein